MADHVRVGPGWKVGRQGIHCRVSQDLTSQQRNGEQISGGGGLGMGAWGREGRRVWL